jgi:hypothetical protein
MNCHGTARAASPAPVRVGVSCERCHGPSSEYLDPHEKGGNPQLGMTALKQPAVQATTCAGCHRITDERLLAASHPSGEAYDIVSATQSIRHWPDRRPDKARQKRGEAAYTGPAEAGLRSAFAQEASSRAIPQVTVAALPAGPTTTSAPAGGPQPVRTPRAQPSRPSLPAREISRKDEPATPSLPPSPAPVRPTPNATVPAALETNPLPAVTDSMTSEDLLLLVKRRLDRLYALLARNRG